MTENPLIEGSVGVIGGYKNDSSTVEAKNTGFRRIRMLKGGAKPVPRRTACKITAIFWLVFASDFITSAIFIRSGYGSSEVNPYQRAFVENPGLETFIPWLMDPAAWYWFFIGASGILLYHFYNVKIENKNVELLLLILKIGFPMVMLIMACCRLLLGTASNMWLIFYKMLNMKICPIIIQLFLLLVFIVLPFRNEILQSSLMKKMKIILAALEDCFLKIL